MSIRGLFRLFLDHENTTESHQNIRNLNKIILFLQRILSASAHTYFLAHRAFSHILGPVVFSFIYPISMSGLHFGFLIIIPHYTDAFCIIFFLLMRLQAGHLKTKRGDYYIEPSRRHRANHLGHPHVVFHRSALKFKVINQWNGKISSAQNMPVAIQNV